MNAVKNIAHNIIVIKDECSLLSRFKSFVRRTVSANPLNA